MKNADVCVRKAETVDVSFDPRHCTGKLYRYTICSGTMRPVIGREMCWHIKHKLNTTRMREAAAFLVGRCTFLGESQQCACLSFWPRQHVVIRMSLSQTGCATEILTGRNTPRHCYFLQANELHLVCELPGGR